MERNSAVDPLRLVLATFVIALHMRFPGNVDGTLQDMLVNGIYRIAVPGFAVIAGYFFLNAMVQGRAAQYIKRILGLYALWTIIYLPMWWGDLEDLKDVIKITFFGYYHLWFLLGLAIAALILLAVRRLNLSNTFIFILAMSCAAAGALVQYVAMHHQGIPLEIYRNGVFSIFPYFAIGWLIASCKDTFPLRRTPLAIRVAVFGTCLLAPAMESLLWLCIRGEIAVDNMLCLPIVAPVMFLVALQTTGHWSGKKMAETATFVYLIHIMVMKASPYFFDTTNMQMLFVMVVSFGLAWGLASLSSGRRMLRALT